MKSAMHFAKITLLRHWGHLFCCAWSDALRQTSQKRWPQGVVKIWKITSNDRSRWKNNVTLCVILKSSMNVLTFRFASLRSPRDSIQTGHEICGASDVAGLGGASCRANIGASLIWFEFWISMSEPSSNSITSEARTSFRWFFFFAEFRFTPSWRWLFKDARVTSKSSFSSSELT